MDWFEFLLVILAGLTAAIPLVIKLVEYVQKAIKEKNWNEIVRLTLGYMSTAEKMFSTGAERKAWVMSMIQSSATTINYDLNTEAIIKISDMIDSICDAAKVINVPKIPEISPTQIEMGQCTFDE